MKLLKFTYSFTFLALFSLLISCSAQKEQSNSAQDNKATTQEKVLIHGRSGDSVGLDPALESDGESIKVCSNIYSNLVRFKFGSTEIEPDLATEWSVSNAGLTYTFKLRKNVLFHDGSPFNADSVLFSLNRQRLKDHPFHKTGGAWQYWEAMSMNKIIKDIKKIDDFTVEFDLLKPNAPFIANLAMHFAAIVSPTAVKKDKKNFKRNPIGTGPFKFKKWVKNQIIMLEANPQYFEGKPKLDKLVFKSIPDNSTRFLEMLSGKIDVMDFPNPSDIKELAKKDNIKFIKQAGMNIGYVAMNMKKPPFNNKKVRHAINMAINKKAIIDNIYEGYGQVAKNPIPPVLWGYNNAVKDFEYNPEKAKQLLKEAGFEKGFTTTLFALPISRPYNPNGKKVAEAIQADLKKVGITVKITTFEWGTYLDKVTKGEHEMAMLGWSGDNGDPDNFLYVLLDKDSVPSGQNIAFFENDDLHKLLIEAQKISDQSKRASLYKQAQVIIREEAPWVNIAHSVEVLPMKKRVKNFKLDPTSNRRYHNVDLED